MKRILFVETKWKAHFWSGIAAMLSRMDADIEIHWLVSNPGYMKDMHGDAFHYVYQPSTATRAESPITESELKKIGLSDRMANFYGARARDFRPVAGRLWEILNDVQPHLIVGEATLPVELLCASLARHLGVLYLVPLTCRYPSGRFCLYEYDTYVPHDVKAVDNLPASRTPAPSDVVDAIREGRDVPDYMRDIFTPVPKDRAGRMVRYLRQQWLNLRSIVRRDPETSTFRSRLWRICEIHVALRIWNHIARRRLAALPADTPRILYPLQVQPEANLDVVGWKYRQQDRLINRILEEMPAGTALLVKPNPKSKCEMNFRLLREVLRDKRCIPLPTSAKMRDLLPGVSLVVSVTGTVTLECMVHEVPVICLGATRDNIFHPVFHPAPFDVLRDSDRWQHQVVSRPVVESFFEWIIRHSFPGEISDPLNSPDSMRDANLKSIAEAILGAVSQVSAHAAGDDLQARSTSSRTSV